jgi:hypothetical protein
MSTYLEEVFKKRNSLKLVCLCDDDDRSLDLSTHGFDYLGWSKCIKCNRYFDLVNSMRSLL